MPRQAGIDAPGALLWLGDSGSGPDGNGGWQVPRAEQIPCESVGQPESRLWRGT